MRLTILNSSESLSRLRTSFCRLVLVKESAAAPWCRCMYGKEMKIRCKNTQGNDRPWLFFFFFCCRRRRRHRRCRGVNDVTVGTWLRLLSRRFHFRTCRSAFGKRITGSRRVSIYARRRCARTSTTASPVYLRAMWRRATRLLLCQEIRTQGKPLAAPACWISPLSRLCRKL